MTPKTDLSLGQYYKEKTPPWNIMTPETDLSLSQYYKEIIKKKHTP